MRRPHKPLHLPPRTAPPSSRPPPLSTPARPKPAPPPRTSGPPCCPPSWSRRPGTDVSCVFVCRDNRASLSSPSDPNPLRVSFSRPLSHCSLIPFPFALQSPASPWSSRTRRDRWRTWSWAWPGGASCRRRYEGKRLRGGWGRTACSCASPPSLITPAPVFPSHPPPSQVSEDHLVRLLDQMSAAGGGAGRTKVTIQRRRAAFDDED